VLVDNPNAARTHARITFDVGNRDGGLYEYAQEVDVPSGAAGYFSASSIPTDFPAGHSGNFDVVVVVGWPGIAGGYTQIELGYTFTVRCWMRGHRSRDSRAVG
jgi:hypothetical protein